MDLITDNITNNKLLPFTSEYLIMCSFINNYIECHTLK